MFLKHRIFALFFNFFNLFALKNNKISFIKDSNESFNGNFKFIQEELENHENFQFNTFFKDKFSLKAFYNLATSKYIFLNDNFFSMAFMNFKSDVLILQLWHAPGAFKKFGASISNDVEKKMIEKISDKTDFLFVSSSKIKKYYKEAFLINENKIKDFGIPRTDYYFKNDLNIENIKKKFYNKYPEAKDKKIVLYAPTFRNKKENNDIFNFFELKKFNEYFGDEYIFTLRLHPKIKKFLNKDISKKNHFIDLTDFENEEELLLIADVLITDYSSIMIEFLILNKPIIFFTYDLDYYLNEDRGFYFDFKKYAPGIITRDMDQLIESFKNIDSENIDNTKCLNYQFNTLDGNVSKRIVDFIVNYEG